MKILPEAGFHWRAAADGSVLYRVNEHAPTHIISRDELQRINTAAEYVAATLVACIVFIFAFNGHWWMQGFRSPEFAALIAFVIVAPAALIGNFAIVRYRILSKAKRAEQDIEVFALTESIALATSYMTRNIGSVWLWLANAVLVFAGCEIAITTIRFLRTPSTQYAGGHQPGPFDGMFYLAFVLFLVYLVTDELTRRKKVKTGA